MSKGIELLGDNRPLILITEIAGLLHDLGKLDNNCFEMHNERIRTEFELDDEKIDAIPRNEIPDMIFSVFRNAKLVFDDKVDTKLINILCEGKTDPTLCSPIFFHHYYKEKYKPRNLFERIIANADSQDSGEDRGATEEESLYICGDCGTRFFSKGKPKKCMNCGSENIKNLYLYSSLQTELIDEQFFEFVVDIFSL